ncbi:hypothetical protein ACFV2H_37660 [Streptomyces sp. NPDC059629]|uniref:hypothetical protein n=1 Tax=Streptomyces sp. NPDC059629 TaxID=3346889 RepID=UPI00369FB4FE
MPDLQVSSDLRSKFSQFHEIASITGELRKNIDQINKYNEEAAGKDDQFAKAYHANSDGATNNLSQLVDTVRELFGITGDGGDAATGLFDAGEDNATTSASSW